MKTSLMCFPCDMQNKTNTVITVALSTVSRAKGTSYCQTSGKSMS